MSVWVTVATEGGAAELLRQDAAGGRVAHAYVFSGVAGRLILDAALAFSAALVCPRGGCGKCEACRRVLRRAHPDVEVVEPAGMQLLVDQVRELVRTASRRPVAAARRVVVVEGADRMNPTAQNAFLKALEEPPASTTIILLAPNPDALLETVRSRCREVIFRPPRPSEIADLLRARGVDPPEATELARVTGDLARALSLAHDEDARRVRAELVGRTVRPLRDPGEALEVAEWLAGRMKAVRERVASEQRAVLIELEGWTWPPRRTADERMRREQRRAEQDALEAATDDVASVLRDLLVLAQDRAAPLMNEALRPLLERRASELGPAAAPRLVACLREVEAVRRRLRANANVLLVLESLFLALYRHLA